MSGVVGIYPRDSIIPRYKQAADKSIVRLWGKPLLRKKTIRAKK